MTISEKITILRKRAGWSQEELAFRLDVSRQAVSKWESGSAVPDIDKIISMSSLFNVSTDSLLKDDAETESFGGGEVQKAKTVSEQDADNYINMVKTHSKRIAFATMLCILSPICLILLAGLSEVSGSHVTEGIALAVGMSVLLVMVASAVAVFIFSGMAYSKYEFLETDKLILSSDLRAKLVKAKEDYEKPFLIAVTIGVVMCILSVLPLMIAPAFGAKDIVYIICVCVLLAINSVAVALFIAFGNLHGSYKKLLEEGEYTPDNKNKFSVSDAFSGIYWSVAVCVYLAWSFISAQWNFTWIVWPIAAVLYGAYSAIVSAITHNKRK